MFYEPGQHKASGFRHDPFKAFVAPRPIGWISTIGKDGVGNLAPYSFFNAVASDPPVVMFAAGSLKGGIKKDSLINAEETGEFVVNIVPYGLRDEMNKSSAHLPSDVDEMPASGLEGLPSTMVKPLRVKGAPVHFECKYLQTLEMPCWREGEHNWVCFGQVIGIHCDDSLLVDGKVDVTSYQPLARLGYMDYTAVGEVFSMNRPD